MKKFNVYDKQNVGNYYIVFAEKIIYLESAIVFKVNDELSSIINFENVTAIVEVLEQHGCNENSQMQK